MWDEQQAIERECSKLEQAIYSTLSAIGLKDRPELKWGASDVRQQNASCEAFGFEWCFQQEGPYQEVWFRSVRFPDTLIPLEQFEWIVDPPAATVTESNLRQQMSRFTTLDDFVPYLRLRLAAIRNVMNEADLPAFDNALRGLRMRSYGVELD